MKICAIILNYFGYKDTISCVKSLVKQQISRIVILENSGCNNEKEKLKSAFEKLSQVDIIASHDNLGFAGGVNYILKQYLPSSFDTFLLLNNDTLVPHNQIKKLVSGMRDDFLDCASPVIYHYPEKNIIWSEGNYYNQITGFITRRSLNLPGEMFHLTGCCLLIKRIVFETVGLLDESFFMYGEDVEFCSRAKKDGFKIGVVPESTIYHRASSSAQNNSLFYEYHLNRGHFLLTKQLYLTKKELSISLSGKILCLGLRAIIRAIRYGNVNSLTGYIKAIKELPRMIFSY